MSYLNDAYLAKFEKKIASFNKKLINKGMEPLHYTANREEVSYAVLRGEPVDCPKIWYKMMVPVWNVVISDDTIIPETGWRLIAVVNHEEHIVTQLDKNIDFSVIEKYRHSTYCDHCHTNRYRKANLIIMNEAGETKSIGTTCASDFFGHNMNLWLQKIGWYLWNPDCFSSNNDEESSNMYSMYIEYPLEEVLACANAIIREYGYTPSSEDLSTKAMLIHAFNEYDYGYNENDVKFAREVIEWAKTVSGSNYMMNIRQIAENNNVTMKNFGYAASMIPTYHKAMLREEENEKKDVRESEYVGNVGDKKVRFDVIYDGSNGFDTDYGWMFIHKFHDNNGNVIIWKSKNNVYDVNVGGAMSFTATIKEHNIYNGTKQTVVIRLKEI